MNACEIIRNHTFWPRSTLQPFSLFVFLPVVACFLCVSVSTFGLSSFIRVRPITFLAAVLFIRWSEINCPGLELDYKGRCHSHPPFAFSLSLPRARVVSSFISGPFRTFFGSLVPGSSCVFIFKTRLHVNEEVCVMTYFGFTNVSLNNLMRNPRNYTISVGFVWRYSISDVIFIDLILSFYALYIYLCFVHSYF